MAEDVSLDIVIRAKEAASEAFKAVKEHAEKLGDSLKDIGKVAAGVVLGGALVGGLEETIGGIFEKSVDAQKGLAQLDSVLQSTHGAAGVTRDAALELADSLSKVTPYSDDVTLSVENMLLTFTSIGKDVFPQATETVLNMATALGEDTKDAAIQLGKALQDPVNGVTALRRVGVDLTDQQKAQIEAMVKAGDVAGAQRIILGELRTEFGNSARAAGDTFGGKLAILHTQLDNVQKAIGGPLLDALSGLLAGVTPLVASFAGELPARLAAFGGLVARLGDIVGPVAHTIADILGMVANVVKAFAAGDANSAFLAITQELFNLGVSFDKTKGPVTDLVNLLFGKVIPAIQQFADVLAKTGDPIDAIGAALLKLGLPLSDVLDAMGFLYGAVDLVKAAFADLTDLARGLGEKISDVTKFINDHVAAQAALFGIATVVAAILAGMAVQFGIATAAAIAHTLATGALDVATGLLAVAQGALNVVMSLNPFVAVTLLVLGLAAGIIYAYQHSQTFRDIVNTAFADIRGFFDALGTKAHDVLTGIQGFLSAAGGAFSAFGSSVQGVIGGIEGFIDGLIGKVRDLTGFIQSIPHPDISLPGIPGHAAGGPVGAGSLSIVGEQGPELFVPSVSGSIVPNSALGGLGGRGVSVHVTVTGNTMLADDSQTARQLARILQPELNRLVTLGA